jgi:outer membrane lipoprotein-sorting protein
LALNTAVLEGVMSVNGQNIQVKITQANDKAQRVDITFGGISGYIIQTRDSGWQYLPFQGQQKAEAMPEAVVKETADALDIQSPLLNYKEKGHTVELLGKEDVDGTECFKIKLVSKSGLEQTIFIDPSNYYIIKTTTKSKASGKEVVQSQTFSNYKKLDSGYIFPFSASGFGPGEVTFTKIEVNKSLDPTLFKPTN